MDSLIYENRSEQVLSFSANFKAKFSCAAAVDISEWRVCRRSELFFLRQRRLIHAMKTGNQKMQTTLTKKLLCYCRRSADLWKANYSGWTLNTNEKIHRFAISILWAIFHSQHRQPPTARHAARTIISSRKLHLSFEHKLCCSTITQCFPAKPIFGIPFAKITRWWTEMCRAFIRGHTCFPRIHWKKLAFAARVRTLFQHSQC